jgi:hypothetical protein
VPDELAAVRAQIRELEAREVYLRGLLIENSDLREGASYIAEVTTTKQQRTDYKELRAMHPALCDEYTFPVEITRVVLSGITSDGEIVSARKLKVTP